MPCVMLANVGNRDVLLDGAALDPARDRGQQVLDAVAQHRDRARPAPGAAPDTRRRAGAELTEYLRRLSFPILEPSLRKAHALEQADRPDAKIERLVLFVTDQPVSVPQRARDTVHLGRVIKEVLANPPAGSWFAEQRDALPRPSAIEVVPIEGTPVHVDEVLPFYQRRVRQARAAGCVYVGLAGGIPACNMALLLAGLLEVGDRARFLYANEATGAVIELGVGRQMERQLRKLRVQALLDRYDFAGAAALLEDDRAAQALARVGEALAAFRFADIGTMAAEAGTDAAGAALTALRQVGYEWWARPPGSPRELIRALWVNARLQFHKKEYTDFLGRVYRVADEALKLAVTEWMGVPVSGRPRGEYGEYVRAIEARPELVAWLEASGSASGTPLRWRDPADGPTVPVLLRLLEHHGERAPHGSPAREFLDLARAIDALVRQRHGTIIGHGTRGASLRDLTAVAPDPLGTVERWLGLLGIDLTGDPFAWIRSRVAAALEAGA
jgi:hypothetical protein